MPLTRQEMEAKLAALEDRISLLTQTVDNLENRLFQKAQEWSDWSLLFHVMTEVVDRQLERDRGTTPESPPT